MTKRIIKKHSTNYLSGLIGGLLMLLLVLLTFAQPMDPDMGWHLRNGADILAKGFPRGDLYSWTMAGYPWVPHEWATDVLMAWLHSWGGLWALVIFFAGVITGIFYLAAGVVKTTPLIRIIVALAGFLVSWFVVGVRPQMFTLLGLAGVLYILFAWRRQPNGKLIYWIPLIFAVWANLHGGFSAGFLIIGIFWIGEVLRHILLGKKPSRRPAELLNWRQLWLLAVVAVGSVIATLFNPNGWRVYLELWQTFTDKDVLANISEWLPMSLTNVGSYNVALIIVLLLGLLWANRWQFDLTKLVLATVVFFISTTAWRHLPIFAIAAMPLLAEQLDGVLRHGLPKLLQTTVGVLGLVLVVGSVAVWQWMRLSPIIFNPTTYGRSYGYPYDAVQYLKAHPEGERMYNEYNWGGYLVWQLPERKVFIDGRMAIWRTPEVKIFDEFKNISNINDAKTALATLDKWRIDTVLTGSNRPLNKYLYGEDGWEVVYQDPLAVVWRRTLS